MAQAVEFHDGFDSTLKCFPVLVSSCKLREFGHGGLHKGLDCFAVLDPFGLGLLAVFTITITREITCFAIVIFRGIHFFGRLLSALTAAGFVAGSRLVVIICCCHGGCC